MSARKAEIYSERVPAGSRTYFFDVKESAAGTRYLLISESRQVDGGSFEHNRVMIFQEHLAAFDDGLKKAVKFMTEPG